MSLKSRADLSAGEEVEEEEGCSGSFDTGSDDTTCAGFVVEEEAEEGTVYATPNANCSECRGQDG